MRRPGPLRGRGRTSIGKERSFGQQGGRGHSRTSEARGPSQSSCGSPAFGPSRSRTWFERPQLELLACEPHGATGGANLGAPLRRLAGRFALWQARNLRNSAGFRSSSVTGGCEPRARNHGLLLAKYRRPPARISISQGRTQSMLTRSSTKASGPTITVAGLGLILAYFYDIYLISTENVLRWSDLWPPRQHNNLPPTAAGYAVHAL
jgi:hypothetical protein